MRAFFYWRNRGGGGGINPFQIWKIKVDNETLNYYIKAAFNLALFGIEKLVTGWRRRVINLRIKG